MDLVARLLNLITQLDHSEQLHNAILSSLSILLSCPLINEKVVVQVATCAFRFRVITVECFEFKNFQEV